jgi:hypothetical protein
MNTLCHLFCILVFLCVCCLTHLWQRTGPAVELAQIHNQQEEAQPFNYSGPKKNIVVLLAYYPESWCEPLSLHQCHRLFFLISLSHLLH